MVKHREPFVDLLTQGMVMGQSYKVKSTGQYIPAEEVEVTGNTAKQISTNEPVELRWEKMSKSKYNGVDPQEVLEEFGIDSTRLCIMGNVSPMSNRHWSNKEFKGIVKWQYRIWNLVGEYLTHSGKDNPVPSSKQELDQYDKEIFEKRNQAVREVSFHFKKTYLLNTAISQLQSFTNILKKCPHGIMYESYEFERSLCDLIIMISPFVPMFASEVWTALTSVARQTDHIYQWSEVVLNQKWPIVDEYYQYPLQVKFNNGDWGEVKLPVGSLNNLSTEQAKDVLYQNQPFQEYCKDRVLSDFKLIVKKDYRAEIYITSKYTEEKKLEMKKAKSMKSKSIAQNN
ncbi:leucine--tRNA ligase, mitochondrial [Patella vulgata]|uniref:leucine--tRNA ligase, mitochondrial n=1 Tax=Patella vulgata TaxID=6465 RepID=UPI0024A8A032|nr:leucine--tRNA ligase, mitochondrial [Patella vulgata]